ncbi:MAG: GlsB/YeaQ/YmgE family stress response membrane protein [Corynebacterium sp.]|nr:GlsB/YeaQ/YmgE family stress response membrane protein [Corynebacterium sp.]
MSIVAWIVLGFVAGTIAKFVMPGRQGGGCIVTTILGILGSVVGGALGSYVYNVDFNQGIYEISTWASAVAGSLVVLAVWGFIRPRR